MSEDATNTVLIIVYSVALAGSILVGLHGFLPPASRSYPRSLKFSFLTAGSCFSLPFLYMVSRYAGFTPEDLDEILFVYSLLVGGMGLGILLGYLIRWLFPDRILNRGSSHGEKG
jgi:hypothetical protein